MQTALDLLAAAENFYAVVARRLRKLLDETEVGGVAKTECDSEESMKVWAKVMKDEGLQVMASTNMVRGEAVGDRTVYVAWRTRTEP